VTGNTPSRPILADPSSFARDDYDQEIDHLTSSYASLKSAQAKYKSCMTDVEGMNVETRGKRILVPLTSSLYVPGRITDPEHMVVDIGTGYYVKKVRRAFELGLVKES
jgi:prefoldin alpha subunit